MNKVLNFEDKTYLSDKVNCDRKDYYFNNEGKSVSCNLLEEKEINWPSSKELDRQCYTKAKYGNIFFRLSNEKFDKDYFSQNLPQLDGKISDDLSKKEINAVNQFHLDNFTSELAFTIYYKNFNIPNELIQRITNEVLELIAKETTSEELK